MATDERVRPGLAFGGNMIPVVASEIVTRFSSKKRGCKEKPCPAQGVYLRSMRQVNIHSVRISEVLRCCRHVVCRLDESLYMDCCIFSTTSKSNCWFAAHSLRNDRESGDGRHEDDQIVKLLSHQHH